MTTEPVASGVQGAVGVDTQQAQGGAPDEAKLARRERLTLLIHSKTFIAGMVIIGFWVICAIFGVSDRAVRPAQDRSDQRAAGAELVDIRSGPTRSAATCCRESSSAPATS